jgi:hypothetical protein
MRAAQRGEAILHLFAFRVDFRSKNVLGEEEGPNCTGWALCLSPDLARVNQSCPILS